MAIRIKVFLFVILFFSINVNASSSSPNYRNVIWGERNYKVSFSKPFGELLVKIKNNGIKVDFISLNVWGEEYVVNGDILADVIHLREPTTSIDKNKKFIQVVFSYGIPEKIKLSNDCLLESECYSWVNSYITIKLYRNQDFEIKVVKPEDREVIGN